MNVPRLLRVASVVVGVLWSAPGWSQPSCDPAVKADVDHPQAYRQRGDRCEGVYWRPHAAQSGLSIAGVRRFVGANALTSVPLRLGWRKTDSIAPGTAVTMRAVLLRSDLYYRMDTNKPYSAGLYEWPTDVINVLRLDLKDFGILASTSTKVGGVNWQVYLPIDIGPPDAASTTYEVTVIPMTALADLSWRCLRIGADGIPAARLASDAMKRQFPANVPIRLRIDLPRFEGFSFVEVSATALSPTATELLHADLAFLAGH